jgi:dGTPase
MRTDAERDRDRILYSSAFQRLTGITQVASPETGAYFHNRLTHSLKVAQVGRRLAQYLLVKGRAASRPSPAVLNLDEDCVEAACLGHDLGHPPFGHVAEKKLNKLASAWGGYEGNAQSFRIVAKLALRDPKQGGLNLTRATMNGLLKYPWLKGEGPKEMGNKWGAYESEREDFAWVREGMKDQSPCVEAKIMDWADDVTYAVHDLEDFYRVGLVPLDRLTRDDVERDGFVGSLFDDEKETIPNQRLRREELTPGDIKNAVDFLFRSGFMRAEPYTGNAAQRAATRARSSALIDRFISAPGVRARWSEGNSPILIDRRYRAEVAVLKELTWRYVIKRPSLETLHRGQSHVIKTLHHIYCAAVEQGVFTLFPAFQQDELAERPQDKRIVTDFVAGLTEELAYELFHRLTGVSKGSILDAASGSGH